MSTQPIDVPETPAGGYLPAGTNGSPHPPTQAPPTQRSTVRLVSVVVQLNLVADDGRDLEPLNVQPIQIPAKEWSNWDLNAVLAQAQAQFTSER